MSQRPPCKEEHVRQHLGLFHKFSFLAKFKFTRTSDILNMKFRLSMSTQADGVMSEMIQRPCIYSEVFISLTSVEVLDHTEPPNGQSGQFCIHVATTPFAAQQADQGWNNSLHGHRQQWSTAWHRWGNDKILQGNAKLNRREHRSSWKKYHHPKELCSAFVSNGAN